MGYLIPGQENITEITIQKSRFVTHINQATTVEEARVYINKIKTQNTSANHNIYAFRIGNEASVVEGMTDDGEPKGTAGPPTLAVVRGSNIGDLVLVTTRYFGGKKLGKGGLVRAYTLAAQTAIETLHVKLKVDEIPIMIKLPYSLYQPVKNGLINIEGKILEENFGANVTIKALIIRAEYDLLNQSIIDLSSGQVVVEQLTE